jgi:predicted glutamine amidotransferase
MCRMFALRANQPTRVAVSLLEAPQSLQRQSCSDRRCESHESGWGIGHYREDQPQRVRSPLPSGQDPQYRDLASRLVSTTVLAHVRNASMGTTAERNSHPFLHGRWLCAHNGTLFGFGDDPERLRRMIPTQLRPVIQGDTDSEHAFALLLARLEQATGSLTAPVSAEAVGAVLAETIRTLAELYPGSEAEPSEFNLVLTDGKILAASRWGHTLSWLERRGSVPAQADAPAIHEPDYQAVAVASEPTTDEPWQDVPEHSVLCIDNRLRVTISPVAR